MLKVLCSLQFLLLSFLASGQIVTAAFDRTNLSLNPAAGTTRTYSQIAIFNNYRKTDSEAKQSQGALSKLTEAIRTNKTGVYYTGEGMFAPEIYLSRDAGEKTFKDGSSTTQTSKMDLINNFINLGFRLKKNFSIGLKYYRPSYDANEKVSFSGGNFTGENKTKTTITGTGLGFNYQLASKAYIGGYYNKITFAQDLSITNKDGTSTTSEEESHTDILGQYGIGFSVLNGTVAKGHRFEVAYSKLEQPKGSLAPAGEEIYLALDIGHRHIAFGGNIKLRKNAYYDNTEILDYAIGDKIFSDSFEPSFSGFFSFQSGSGHTFGFSGLLYNTTGQREFYGVKQDAEMKVLQLTGNYAYLF